MKCVIVITPVLVPIFKKSGSLFKLYLINQSVSVMSTEKKKRTRLSPDARKEFILDHAAEVVVREGVSALSMERLGKEASISKSLVYSYYPSVKEVLQSLIKREYQQLRTLQEAAASKAETFEQLVRGITTTYLTFIEQRGVILERLTAEPSLAEHVDPTAFSRDIAVRYLAKIVHLNFAIDMETALAAVDISFGMPAAAGHYLIRHNVSRRKIEDITTTMIIGSISALHKNYQTTFKPLIKSGNVAQPLV